MPARILVVDDDPVTLTWLKAVLERENYIITTASRGQTALDQITASPPDLVVLDLILPDIDGLDILRRLRQNPDLRDLWVIILSVKDRPDDIVTGLRAGADDYVPKRPGADIEVISKIRGLLAGPRKSESQPVVPQTPDISARIFSFCSAKGGAGTTSVCVNTAYALAQLDPNAEVLLVDMVLPLGTIGPAIGYTTTDTIGHMIRELKGKLNSAIVEKHVSPLQRWGFRVLLATGEPQEAMVIEGTQVGPLFEMLKSMYDYVLVDLGRTLSKITLPIIQSSDHTFVVLTPDINVVKQTGLLLDYIETLGVPRTRMSCVNNRTMGRVWISNQDIEAELDLAIAGTVPFENEFMTMAINAGTPFAAKFPDHLACQVFTGFARIVREQAGR